MTKKLEDLFDLADTAEETEEKIEELHIEADRQQIRALDSAIDKIDAALPSVRDISTSDAELDRLSKLAEDSFSDLMELGMNVEPRFGAEIFTTASSMLGHAISAKNSKIDKKLKIVSLQIQKARLDLQAQKLDEDGGTGEGEAKELDRNALLALFAEQNKKDETDK